MGANKLLSTVVEVVTIQMKISHTYEDGAFDAAYEVIEIGSGVSVEEATKAMQGYEIDALHE